uniref:Uncharacterized protein n=1 Tax=Anthoceros angustus TaxID=48387 RepID=A0A2P1L4X7_ANTAG|nr:hypothetical protein AnanMp53 [Anthoceros angustus]AVP12865.1 hypothetical protein AnanMp53 [Anthoceros angustus]
MSRRLLLALRFFPGLRFGRRMNPGAKPAKRPSIAVGGGEGPACCNCPTGRTNEGGMAVCSLISVTAWPSMPFPLFSKIQRALMATFASTANKGSAALFIQ